MWQLAILLGSIFLLLLTKDITVELKYLVCDFTECKIKKNLNNLKVKMWVEEITILSARIQKKK